MVFSIVGYCVFVLFGIFLAIMVLGALKFGGGDCGPIFGNWVHKGTYPRFAFLVIFTIVVWYFIIITFPFSVSIA